MNMIVIDLLIAVLLGYALFKGLQKGLIVSVISLIALIAGIYFSLRFSFFTSEILQQSTQWSPNAITVSAFFITFSFVLVLLFLLGKILTKLVNAVALGFINKLAGAVFESLKMILIISVFLNLFQKINYNNLLVSEEKLEESVFYHSIEEVSRSIFPLMDKWYKAVLNEVREIEENKKQPDS